MADGTKHVYIGSVNVLYGRAGQEREGAEGEVAEVSLPLGGQIRLMNSPLHGARTTISTPGV